MYSQPAYYGYRPKFFKRRTSRLGYNRYGTGAVRGYGTGGVGYGTTAGYPVGGVGYGTTAGGYGAGIGSAVHKRSFFTLPFGYGLHRQWLKLRLFGH